jgi:hypothetical protein
MTLAAVSCTRMPTAPPTPVTVHGMIAGPSGEPVPYAFIQFLPIDVPPPDNYNARTDSSGSYSLELLTGSYEMRVFQSIGNNGWLGYANRIHVTRDHARFDYAFHGFKVTGKLLDPEGGILTDGRIVATIEAEHPSSASFNVSDGQFSLLLPAGRYTIRGYAGGFAAGYTAATLQSVPVSGDTVFDVRLPGVLVTGTVLGPDGMPVPYAIVDGRSAVTETDSNGIYRLYLTEGPHAILCDPQLPGVVPRQVVLAIPGPTTINFDFRGVTWSGTVVTAGTNQPVVGCHVSVHVLSSHLGANFHTDDQGAFRFVMEPHVLCELEAHLHDEVETQLFRGFFRATTDTTFAIVAPAPVSP